MHSERLRETIAQRDESLIGRRPQPMNSPDERASASMLASDETRRRENEKDWDPTREERESPSPESEAKYLALTQA
jgi:hypothetical protein